MACFRPIVGYRARKTENGKRGIVFSPVDGFRDLPVKLPCGKCVGCRLERARQWAVRIMHEASTSDGGWFVTLTYDDVNLPAGGSLVKADLQKFWKRLRKAVKPERVRYFACGEYGEHSHRPHYHACMFGPSFADRRVWSRRKEHTVFRSESLEQAWPLGHSEIGSLTFESASYVARYCVKGAMGAKLPPVMDVESGEIIEREPEFAVMSRRPGIGYEWLKKYGDETYRDDTVVMRGHEMKPPRYYDDKYSEVEPEVVESVKARREEARQRENETDARLEAREKVAIARLNLRPGGKI